MVDFLFLNKLIDMRYINSMGLIVVFLLFGVNMIGQHKNILISEKGNPNEPSICINPKNPAQLVAGCNINKVFYSSDTGKTWQSDRLKSQYGVWGDPSIMVDTNGNFYFFHLSNALSWIDRIVCQRSDNGGKDWSMDTYMGYTQGKNQDKQWPVVDPKTNMIYVTWTQFDHYGSTSAKDSSNILFSRSYNGGLTWSSPLRLNKVAGDCIDSDNTVEGAVPAVGPNGEVYVCWAGPLGLMFDKSLDQGSSWLQEDKFVTSIPGGWDFGVSGIYRCNGLPVTVCDLSDGEHRGTIYINWSDQRNGVDDTDIWLVKSEDGGDTWTKPKRVNDDLPGRQQFFTWMSIDQTTGYLYFVFYDRRNYEDDKTDVFMAVSKDGGETFTNFKVSDTPFTPNSDVFFGDYTNISVINGVVRPIWTRLDQFDMSVWTALVNVDSLSTSVKKTEIESDLLSELKNSPNPYSDKTAISFKLRKASKVSLFIYDSVGNLVSRYITDAKYDYGKHIIVLDNKELNLASGMYYYSLKIDDAITAKKMIVIEK